MSYLSNEQKEVAAQALATDPVWQRQIWEPQSILFQGLHWLSSCFTFCFHPHWAAGEGDGSILNSDCTGSSRNTRQRVTENQDFCHSIPRWFLPLPQSPSLCWSRSLCLCADEQHTSHQIRYTRQAPHATKSSSNTSWVPGKSSPGLCEEIMQWKECLLEAGSLTVGFLIPNTRFAAV